MTERGPAPAAIIVRAAQVSDAPAIAEVHVASWRAAYVGVVPQHVLDRLSVDRRRTFWAGRLSEPADRRVFVAELDGRIVGFAGTSVPTDPGYPAATAELDTIYLVPDAWQRGIGRRLMARALDDLAARGFSAAILWVLAGNGRGRRFYEARGWQPDGHAQMLDFDGSAVEEVRYRVDLPRHADAAD